jgi:hypothetical protein
MFGKNKKNKITITEKSASKKLESAPVSQIYGQDDTPFFVLGCVRSGTTLLRDILRQHPRLESPEETHFFRWSDPYGSPRYDKNYIGTKLFKEHRVLDGVSDKDFHGCRMVARNRKDLSDLYGKYYLAAQDNIDGRWFDKTPQNIYNILLLGYMYPEAKFVHIYRNPLNVVSSLKEGKVMAKHDTKGGVNYWMESMIMINEYKKMPGAKERFIEIKYEEMVASPKKHIDSIFEFVGEDPALMSYKHVSTHKEKDKYKSNLSDVEIEYVKELTEPFRSMYGYI